MSNPDDDIRKALEREVELATARKASATGSKPAITLESVVRAGTRFAARAAIVGGGTVLSAAAKGLADARRETEGTGNHAEGKIIGDQAANGSVQARQMGTLERWRAKIDMSVADLAHSKVSLRTRFMWWAAKRSIGLLNWSMRTYPWALRPVRFVSHVARNRLNKRITKQNGRATNLELLRLRLYDGVDDIGSGKGPSSVTNMAVNLFTAAALASTGLIATVDGLYSYGTYKIFDDVHITRVFRGPNNDGYGSEIHGYQIGDDGRRIPLFFENKFNLFYGKFWPQYDISDISDGDNCRIAAYGTNFRIPVAVRKLLSLNPSMIKAECHRPTATLQGSHYEQSIKAVDFAMETPSRAPFSASRAFKLNPYYNGSMLGTNKAG